MAVKADITIDIDKQVGNLQNLTNIYNARVGDSNTPLTVLWQKNGMALNLKGLHAFIAGKVGDGSYNTETDKVDFPVGTPVVKYEDDGSGTLDDGQSGLTTLLIPQQMWAKTGLFAGYIGLKDDNGSVFTSKDIFFKVLGNVLDAGVEINYFIGDFDKALAKAEKELEDKSANFDQTTAQALQDLHDKYLAEAQKAEDTLGDTQASIDANLASLKLLATHIGSLEAQLKASDVVSVSDFNSKIDYLDQSINNRLAQIDTNIEAFSTLNELSTKYPQGKPGLFYAAGHLYIYDNGWIDQGTYPSAALTESETEILNNAIFTKAFLYDPKQLVTPYNDADLFPTNTVITFATDMSQVLHVPKQLNDIPYSNGTFITIGNSQDGTFHDKPKDGTFQEFISSNGYQSQRILWGGSWTEWLGPDDNENSKFISNDQQIQSPYDDLDTLPLNSTVIYIINNSNLKHTPTTAGFTIKTMGLKDQRGRVQLLVTEDGCEYSRIFWNDKYQDWRQIYNRSQTNIYSDAMLSSNYADAFELPADSNILYSIGIDKIKNCPPETSWASVITQSPMQDIKTASLQLAYYGNGHIWSNVNNAGNHSGWEQIKTQTPNEKEFELAKPSLSMFGKFGVVGDSYASGVLEDFNHKNKDIFATMTPEMIENLSWPTMLARKWGTSTLHLAKGGLSTRTWLTDDQGLTKLNGSDPQDIYYLCLGINDYYGLGASYLGSESDMDAEADTFYGNYAKIIKSIKTKAPLAKIIMFGITNNPSDSNDLRKTFADAQQKIANHFNIPYISQNDDKLFTSTYYSQNMGSGHPSSYLYGALANAYERLIQKVIYRNRDYFYDYGWNGELN